jgi:hypothetical protein
MNDVVLKFEVFSEIAFFCHIENFSTDLFFSKLKYLLNCSTHTNHEIVVLSNRILKD